jgi:hypothetical protein
LRHVPEPWNYALVGGLASVPVTLLLYWQAGLAGEISLNAVFLGGLIAGSLAERADGDVNGAGARAGLIGGLPALLTLSEVVTAAAGLAGPAWFQAAGLGMTLVVGVTVLAFATLAGLLGAALGGWLLRRRTPARPATGS